MGKIRLRLVIGALFIVLASECACAANDRMLLWHVVQACVANHRVFGAQFPCLEVNIASGSNAGYAVLKAPLEATHIIVTPVTRVSGIESAELLAAGAPDYIKLAWGVRHYVADRAGRPLAWDDFGLAVNSALGRGQDQLHIHIDCAQSYVHKLLQDHPQLMNSGKWVHFEVPLYGARYWVLFINNPDLTNVSVLKLAMSGLHVEPAQQGNLSLALIGAVKPDGQKGFYLLADLSSPPSSHYAHAENLLDHTCAK